MQFFPVLFSDQTPSAGIKAQPKDKTSGVSFEGLLNASGNMGANSMHSAINALSLPGNSARADMVRNRLLTGGSKDDAVSGLRDGKIDVHTFHGLKTKLSELGVDDSTLEELENSASEGSLTWNSLLHTLTTNSAFTKQETAGFKLDDATRNGASVFLQKLGFTPDESSSILETAQSGNLSKAWNSVLNKINAMPEGTSIDIAPEELANIGKALKLDENGIARMQQLFAGQQSATVDAKNLKSLLAEISNSVNAKRNAAEERVNSLHQTLAPAMEEAWERSGRFNAADMRASKETTASSVLIKDSVTAAANGFTNATAGSAGNKEVNREARNVSKHDKAEDALKNADKQHEGKAEGRAAIDKQHNSEGRQFNRFNDSFDDEAAKDQTKGKKDALKTLLERLEFQPQSAATTTQTSDPNAALAAGGLRTATARNADRQIFEQVENGMLRTMQNGGKQLTLQLTPEDLGKVTVILSVKNHEVNAVIRPESAEAAKAINDQLHQLKASLENQGLKVDNIEVQTGLQNQQNNSSWQGSMEHNAQQELRQKFLNQRRLHSMRADGSALAQEMHNTGETAKHSTHQGLDIIA
ncbi:flagellar hook-length control protein FliK [Desulfovibrio mangrovi]|uniref:flagellar hook-length control protein FliK n=1 Tax=Desulfovibrio mangrovi TaxID=2976983 RepID=UPI002247648A|nr:flagellar hook-length control protein FliK [Desulfovibrio mangrovi]UZP68181.1 flagellar hook-length control protein FliK [Desulfovibrio mangrovi]